MLPSSLCLLLSLLPRCRDATGELRLFPAGAPGVPLAVRWDPSPGSRSGWQPVPSACAKCVGFMSRNRNLKGFFWHEKRVLLALAKYTVWFLSRGGGEEQIKNTKKKRERKKEGRKQLEFSFDILSTHPCVSFPSGRNKNCLCFF